jgi:hypothetical protein
MNSTAINSSSLEELAFSVAVGYDFTEKNTHHFILSEIFSHCRNLKRLDLSYNKLKLSDTNLRKMFQPLDKLKTFILQDMNMHCIPDNLGEIFPDLEYLDLSNNKIKTWNRPFANFHKLKVLYLNGNKISTINDTSFPTSWMTAYGTLKRLKLRDNPFVCNCDLTWFRQWIDRSKGYNISTDRMKWLCSGSTPITVLEYHPERDPDCLLAFIVTSCVALFIPVLLFIRLDGASDSKYTSGEENEESIKGCLILTSVSMTITSCTVTAILTGLKHFLFQTWKMFIIAVYV